MAIDKGALQAALLAELGRALERAETAQRDAHEGATHEEARPESDKDTRAVEASYLARGLAERVEDLRAATARVEAMPLPVAPETITLGCCFELCDGDESSVRYFLAPAGGGLRIRVQGEETRIVTPDAPLARAVIGRRLGDSILRPNRPEEEVEITVLV